ncbi:MAG: hypothetical protein ACREDR_20465 [Blastocatellia bacterium]
MPVTDDSELLQYPVHRALSDPVYRICQWYICLTDSDLALILFFCPLTWLIVQELGWSNVEIVFGLKADPFLGFMVAIFLIVVLSALRHIRPEGDILQVVRGLGQPRLYSPRTHRGDRTWQQAPHHPIRLVPAEHRLRVWPRYHG